MRKFPTLVIVSVKKKTFSNCNYKANGVKSKLELAWFDTAPNLISH
jgi:hypothetical protein